MSLPSQGPYHSCLQESDKRVRGIYFATLQRQKMISILANRRIRNVGRTLLSKPFSFSVHFKPTHK